MPVYVLFPETHTLRSIIDVTSIHTQNIVLYGKNKISKALLRLIASLRSKLSDHICMHRTDCLPWLARSHTSCITIIQACFETSVNLSSFYSLLIIMIQ